MLFANNFKNIGIIINGKAKGNKAFVSIKRNGNADGATSLSGSALSRNNNVFISSKSYNRANAEAKYNC